MKTIYLLGWLISAIFLCIWTPYFMDAAVLFIFNAGLPLFALVGRMVEIHSEVDESKIKL